MLDPSEHAENRGAIESVLRHIPGFRGYLEKEYRRDSDELQRAWLADRLQASKHGLETAARRLVDAGQLDMLPRLDRLRARLDLLIGRIRGAMQGYSGFFDLVQIDEHVLDRVYQHDAHMVEAVEGMAAVVERMANEERLDAPLVQATQQLDDLLRQWDQRAEILKGLS